MNLLLDTHAWLWFHLGDPQLSATAQSQILNPANVKFISPASYWEISIKISLNKYALNVPYAQFMHDSIVSHGFKLLPISTAHTERVGFMPFHHRDPFDRMLIAQATVEGMTIISNDRNFPRYGVVTLW